MLVAATAASALPVSQTTSLRPLNFSDLIQLAQKDKNKNQNQDHNHNHNHNHDNHNHNHGYHHGGRYFGHRYYARPYNWQALGCVVVGPDWCCPCQTTALRPWRGSAILAVGVHSLPNSEQAPGLPRKDNQSVGRLRWNRLGHLPNALLKLAFPGLGSRFIERSFLPLRSGETCCPGMRSAGVRATHYAWSAHRLKADGPILGTRAKGMSFSTNRHHCDMWRNRDKAS